MKIKIAVETQGQMARWVEHMRAAGLSQEPREWRRGHCRLTFDAPGTVEAQEGSEGIEPIKITTHDLSAEGLGFLCPHCFKEGQNVLITIETGYGEIEIPATVIHCTETFGMFKVGVKFDLADQDDHGSTLPDYHRLSINGTVRSPFDLAFRMPHLFPPPPWQNS